MIGGVFFHAKIAMRKYRKARKEILRHIGNTCSSLRVFHSANSARTEVLSRKDRNEKSR